MADDNLQLSFSTPAAPSPTTPGSSAHFYPFATSPDIIRSHEKDAFLSSSLVNQAQSIARSLRGARFAHTHSDAIKHLTELLYFSLTTLIGNRTLGEEYCDLVQLEDDSLQLPSVSRRAGYILSTIMVPWTLQKILPGFRQRLRAKLERSIARQQLQAQQKAQEVRFAKKKDSKKNGLFTMLRIQKYILEHLDSITSLSPIYALSIATFYFTGSYYHLSKRFWGLRYVFTKKLEENEQRVGYEVLGVLLVLQIAVQGVLHVRTVLQQQDEGLEADSASSRGSDNALIHSIQNPPSLPLLPASSPRYDLSEDSNAIPWIPSGQQSKCTLCLESYKDPSVTTCGHVFCWTCVRDWVREKPECPLCRQEVLLSKVLPLRG
ncbi:ubiquitin-protein ligase peroxin 10 [Aspergillus clavatus NRRL 1]|uniref:RING-type E3 ubiquitin transferase n=1 Tax=Aspergillus clavatus (strain ATCC 1007 / CBS 513.65 / DSM 816 / NCTC 3887 / NRRL 1 / QM 1276 / 107) TaxID=344612 RepID=A1CDB3_ASPCL|nr:peroxisome biosynthesis protein (Peroxin-10), putative [Aspergillus clavatus NRRL 1]EAW11840.1 peroxisome biosynthesis protein (Peroxin-10), putative [Aspergillus clavatus NRRL 1]